MEVCVKIEGQNPKTRVFPGGGSLKRVPLNSTQRGTGSQAGCVLRHVCNAGVTPPRNHDGDVAQRVC